MSSGFTDPFFACVSILLVFIIPIFIKVWKDFALLHNVSEGLEQMELLFYLVSLTECKFD